MATHYKTPESYEHALELQSLGLLLNNISSAEPRAQIWRLAEERNNRYMEEAFQSRRTSGDGWWVCDYAYVLED